jgi:hypothetical protein
MSWFGPNFVGTVILTLTIALHASARGSVLLYSPTLISDNKPSRNSDNTHPMPESSASAGIVVDLPIHEARTPSPQESHFQLFAQLAALQSKRDHYGLIQAAERADLDV